jgi:hypothetical protein
VGREDVDGLARMGDGKLLANDCNESLIVRTGSEVLMALIDVAPRAVRRVRADLRFATGRVSHA